MLETICSYPSELVMGIAGLVGAGIMSGLTIYEKKKEDKDFKFSFNKIIDTIWQSTLAGVGAGIAIGCSLYGIIIAAITGFGADKLANKLHINKAKLFNIVELLSTYVEKKIKKK